MIYLTIGIIGLGIFMKDTVIELIGTVIGLAYVALDTVWDKVFG